MKNLTKFSLLLLFGSLVINVPVAEGLDVLEIVENILWTSCKRIGNNHSASDIKYYVFTYENATNGVEYDGNSTTGLQIDLSRDTKIIIHGWTEYHEKDWIQNMTNAYYTNGYDYNIIVVDWSAYGNFSYLTSICYVPIVGQMVAEFITNVGFDTDRVHVVAHSLGAQVAGYVGQNIYNVQGKKLKRITGLDAAGPMFCFPVLMNSDRRLSADDAQLVDAIHTNDGYNGCKYNYGTVDFRVNCGSSQTGCDTNYKEEGATSPAFCNHYRSYKYFVESIYDNCFDSLKCDSCNNNCSANDVAQMGEYMSENAQGSYYLNTTSFVPYCINN